VLNSDGDDNQMMDEPELPPERLANVFASFVNQIAAAATNRTSPLLAQLTEHLGADLARLPVTVEQFDTFEQPNLQLALDAYLAREGRSARLVGVSMQNKRFMAVGLSELATWRGEFPGPSLAEGPVDYVNFHLADGQVLACVQFGLYLVRAGEARLVALVTGPSEMGDPRRQKLRLEVMSPRHDDGPAFIADVRELMTRLNVYRGHAISLSAAPMHLGPGPVTLIQFQSVPTVGRADVVLPDGLLERIERHTVTFSAHAAELLAAGRSLKRGLLLYGLPGTGKTLTVMYLIGRLPGRTVILTTGRGLGLVQTVAELARQLVPSMVVLEDVDLVAEERTMPGFGARPVLFELLNEMDGLREDQDVIFVLTTNRPDILEPALAARPGRIDLAVELPVPDAPGRRRLIDLYGRGLTLEGIDMAGLVARTEGATPAYIKELMRKAALHAAESGSAATVRQEHVDGALDELAQGGRLAERILGFRPEPAGPEARPGIPPGTPTGFPWSATVIRRDG
jgi:cell division protease FtsH